MSMFPFDVLSDILCCLPPKALLRFRCLSKSCRSLIDSHDFIKNHLNKSINTGFNLSLIVDDLEPNGLLYAVDLDSLDMNPIALNRPFEPHPNSYSIDGIFLKPCRDYSCIIGSCNGLVALYDCAVGMALWNPSTKRHQMLALPAFWGYPGYENSVLDGFGYDASSDDYKFIRIYLAFREKCSTNMLYSLKTNASRKIKGFPKCYYSNDSQVSGVLVGDCLHWLISEGNSYFDDDLIVAFDLVGEKFHIVSRPCLGHGVLVTLGVLGGCISMGCIFTTDFRVEIWVMKEYMLKHSWTKICSISREGHDELKFCRIRMKPLGYSKLGNKILFEQDGRYIFWYDQEEKKFENVDISSSVSNRIFAQLCVRSLVQMDATVASGPLNKRKRMEPNPGNKKR